MGNKLDIEKELNGLNLKLSKIEEKILKDKTPEEQEKIKLEWENTKKENEKKLKEEADKFNKQMQDWEQKQKELMPIEDIRNGLKEMMKELDDKWNKTLKSAIEELCKGKTAEEKEKILKAFKNIENK